MSRRHCYFLAALAAALGNLFPVSLLAVERAAAWPSFRGSDRSAVAPDVGLLTAWPEGGPKLLWQSAGAGRGYSSLAIAGGQIYTLGDAPSTAKDEEEYLLAFDQADGRPRWQLKTGPAWTDGKPSWQSSRSTPTVDRDQVYVLTPHGVLVAASTSGSELWRQDLAKEFAGEKADKWGYSESVLADGDRVICTPGGEKHTLVALDRRSGQLIWSCSRAGDRGAGHASIVASEIAGERIYVQSTGSGAMGVRASDGKLLWTYDIEQTTAVIPSPIVRGDLVFFTAGYGRGGTTLRQQSDGEGVKVTELYPLNRELANKHGGVVLVGDYLFGDSDDRGIPFCAELLTGQVKWKHRGSGRESASLCAADGHLYIRYANGTMTLVKASPEAFEEVGSFVVPGSGERPSWAHPVIVDGKLYLREGDALLCYDLRG